MTTTTDTTDTATAIPETALEQELADRGLGVDELASAARINPGTVHSWVTSGVVPRRSTAQRIAQTLQVPAERLWPQLSVTPLTAELTRQGMTIRDLAAALEVHENSAYRWSTGDSDPRPAMAVRIAHALDVPVARLFPHRTGDLTAEHTPHASGNGHSRAVRGSDGADHSEAEPSRLGGVLWARGLTAVDLARRIGVDKSVVQGWVNGEVPAAAQAEQAAAALDVDPAEIFDRVRLTKGWGHVVHLDLVPGAPTITQILETEPTGDPDWASNAACAGSEHDPEAWWPDPTDPAAESRKVCGGCPVLGDCRQAFLTDQRSRLYGGDGIWAGLPGRALTAIARSRAHGYHTTPLPAERQQDSQRRPAAVREIVDRREAGRRLAEAMHTRGLNAAQLAADLGVSRSAVLKWRQGVQTPRPDYAERLADRLGIPPDQLLPLQQPVNAREGITL